MSESSASAAAPPPERRIVVAVDESEESMHALRWCLRNLLLLPRSTATPAGEDGSPRDTVILLYVRPPPPSFSPFDGTGYLVSDEVVASIDRYSKDLAGSVMEKARKICEQHNYMDRQIKVEEKVSSGDAREVICEMAERMGADLLVMGSHGYGFIRRALLGSVSDYCARNAKCPVLIVKPPPKA